MSAYSEKVAKAKHGFYRVADFETVREVTHTIAYLLEDQVVFDGEKKDILCFEDTGRQLILNVTNAEMLIALFGDEPNGWAGRRVTLYRGSYGKDNKPCVRVKAANGARRRRKCRSLTRRGLEQTAPQKKRPRRLRRRRRGRPTSTTRFRSS